MTTLRVAALQALYDHRTAITTAELAEEVGGETRGLSEEDIKHVLDGLSTPAWSSGRQGASTLGGSARRARTTWPISANPDARLVGRWTSRP